MATDIDLPPLDDVLAESDLHLSSVWRDYISRLIDTLTEYLSERGIFVPRLTTAERNAIQEPTNGQLIYNTTLAKFQGYEGNVWTNLI